MHAHSVSIIISTYNRRASLQRTLKSLADQTYPFDRFDVILIDDGSTDDTQAVTNVRWPFHLQYHYQENQGIARARNWAAERSQAEVLVFLDDDIVVNDHYLEAMLRPFTLSAAPTISMATLLPPPDRPPTAFHRLYINRIHEFDSTQVASQDPFPIRFYNCTGGVIAIRRHDYLDLGGTQELPNGAKTSWGGLDLAYRAFKRGFSFVQVPTARAIHYDYAIADLHSYMDRMYRVGRYAVLLLHKYPELEQLVPLFHDRTLPRGNDPLALRARKSLRTLANSRWARSLYFNLIEQLEPYNGPESILWKLYVWVISSSITIGMNDGIVQFGTWTVNE